MPRPVVSESSHGGEVLAIAGTPRNVLSFGLAVSAAHSLLQHGVTPVLKIIQKFIQKRQTLGSFRSLLKGSGNLRAQNYQDIFALVTNDFKRGGFFVEFGATDGKDLSNTWVLEKCFEWTGILAEPGRVWHKDLFANRNCSISTDCVWRESGKTLNFLESAQPTLSTIRSYSNSDGRNRLKRGGHSSYSVNTISLVDLLRHYEAPRLIDFMSLDTEGSEFDILSSFDWDLYQITALCVEHNYTSQRDKIHALLVHHGYRRVYEGISGSDDWYQRS